MGSPQPPDRQQYAKLEEAGRLEMLDEPNEMAAPGGTAIIHFSLPRHGISLFRLTRLDPSPGSALRPAH
jgi:hypothetical protein